MAHLCAAPLKVPTRSAGLAEFAGHDEVSVKSQSTSADSSPRTSVGSPTTCCASSGVENSPIAVAASAWGSQAGAAAEAKKPCSATSAGDPWDVDAARRCLLPGFLEGLWDGAFGAEALMPPPGLEPEADGRIRPAAARELSPMRVPVPAPVGAAPTRPGRGQALPPPPPPGLAVEAHSKDTGIPSPPLLPPALDLLGSQRAQAAAPAAQAPPAYLATPPPRAPPDAEKLAALGVPQAPALPPMLSVGTASALATAPPPCWPSSWMAPCSAPVDVAPVYTEASPLPPPPAGPAVGSFELPTLGSALHGIGECQPCAFVHAKGCVNGVACQFCHLCDAGEKKRRKKEKHALLAAARRAARLQPGRGD